jgi:hypothetical protein
MRRRSLLSSLTVFLLLPLATAMAANRDSQWKQVVEAVAKELPKTAIEQLQPIIEAALQEKAYPEALKAIRQKIDLESQIEGSSLEPRAARWEAEIAKAPPAIVPAMRLLLGDYYWTCYHWEVDRQFRGRTDAQDEFASRDPLQFWAKADEQFEQALAAEAELKKTPFAEYGTALDFSPGPNTGRLTTLYDFAAYEALNFYLLGRYGLAEPEDAFELTVDSPIFAPVEEFLKWEMPTADKHSPTIKIVRLYQALLRFHQGDSDKEAYLDADRLRLKFGYEKASGGDRSARYKAAMKRYLERWSDCEYSSEGRADLATLLYNQGDPLEAHEVAKAGANLAPWGSYRCSELVRVIESPSVNVAVERVWNEPWPSIRICYRNLTQVHFRAIRDDWFSGQKNQIRRGIAGGDPDVLAKKPDLEWSAALPATADFRERVKEIPAPKGLKPGFYYLVASCDPKFRDKVGVTEWTSFWVSDLALVTKVSLGDGMIQGFVLDARSGEPIEGADVQAWLSDPVKMTITAGATSKTDRNGLFSVPGTTSIYKSTFFFATYKDQQLVSRGPYFNEREDERRRPYEHTVLFTDRSIYRPGQTIHYKGIVSQVDRSTDRYQALPKHHVYVCFTDADGQEIANQQQVTNDFGSFSGTFIAPADRLSGRMRISVNGDEAVFHVEEYKRPTFKVFLDAPKAAAKLGGQVRVEGRATAYTGAAVGGATVRYRVARIIQYPDWPQFRYARQTSSAEGQEIAHATLTTDANGNFAVQFTADPDPQAQEEDEPAFEFSISVDVTDATGETCGAQRKVDVGFTALRASMTAAEWLTDQKPVEIAVTTQSLDGVPQQAEGPLKIYRLQQPEQVHRPAIPDYLTTRSNIAEAPDPTQPAHWKPADVVAQTRIATDPAGHASFSARLPPGAYLAQFDTRDRFGKAVVSRLPLQVLAADGKSLPLKVPYLVAVPKSSLEPGEEFMALWGSGYDRARAFIEIEHRGKILQGFWTEAGRTQQAVRLPVTEAMRGGFTLRVSMVRENRAYLTSRKIDVPWTNKNLNVKWEHFVSKLRPAQKETWTAVISGPDAKTAVAEMVATLYDRSLDAYLPQVWQPGFGVFRQDWSKTHVQFENLAEKLVLRGEGRNYLSSDFGKSNVPRPIGVAPDFWGYEYEYRTLRFQGGRGPVPSKEEASQIVSVAERVNGNFRSFAPALPGRTVRAGLKPGFAGQQAAESPDSGRDLSYVAARKNLDETAFFLPHLLSNEEGVVRLEFTMPETLTNWRFLGFAHDRQLRAGLLEGEAVTAKDLMVRPNPPRFLREGDVLEFTVKVSNQSAERQAGKVQLTLADAQGGKSLDATFGNSLPEVGFDVPPRQSRTYAWKLSIPDRAEGVLIYKAVASTGRLSDGEEAYLPVLSRRVLVTEALPLQLRDAQTKHVEFPSLLRSGESKTIQHESLTVQMASHPSWYAVMSLPCLMENPWECSERTFGRLFACALARHVVDANPKIRRVFEQWRDTPALDSPLEKNQALKAVLLEETPWIGQAQAESRALRNIGAFFDDTRLQSTVDGALQGLREMQRQDGTWPWFAGGPNDDFSTLYVVAGFGRLRHLGVKDPRGRYLDESMGYAAHQRMLDRLDAWIDRLYRRILADGHPQDDHLSPLAAFCLYGRSFFLENESNNAGNGRSTPAPGSGRGNRSNTAGNTEAVDYFLGQGRKYWAKLPYRRSQAHLALALKRFGDPATAQDIARSLKERSVRSEESGMSWRDEENLPYWYQSPIGTQAMMIEVFDEVAGDRLAVEDCKLWLLKHKQVHGWNSTMATADAVYALLLRSDDSLTSDELVAVTLGQTAIKPEKVEAGTGFFEHRFLRGEVLPELGRITLTKADPGVAWGAVHWQYLEDVSKAAPYEGPALQVSKSLYTRQVTKEGPLLGPLRGPVRVGDELVVRLTVRTDRELEYVHLKDQRPSGAEPVSGLSRYKFQDKLAYYETTRDTATHFFIDRLPRGPHVFEYSMRAVHKGQYQTGMATVQCMYAPEFGSHSESGTLIVGSAD